MTSRRPSGRSSTELIDAAQAVLREAKEQIDAEQFSAQLIPRLDAAAEVFSLNGRPNFLSEIAALRPQALMARGDFGAAVVAALRAFDDQSMSASLRIRAGAATVFLVELSEHHRDTHSFVDRYTRLCQAAMPDESALAGSAALERSRLFRALSEAGIASAPINTPQTPPTRSPDALRAFARASVASLEDVWKRSGIVRPRQITLPLSIALGRCIAEPEINIAQVFAWARAFNPASQPIGALLTEGHAHRIAGDHGRAIAVLTQAIERARAGAAMHRLAFAHFEMAHALAGKEQFDLAWTHMVAYARVMQSGLEEALTQLGALHAASDTRTAGALLAGMDSKTDHLHGEPAYLTRARRYVESHLQAPLKMQDVVAASGASRRALELAFRKTRGMSPMEFVKDARLSRANMLLRSSELSVTEIRTIVGYRSASAFSTDFRKRFGASPLQVRQSVSPRRAARL